MRPQTWSNDYWGILRRAIWAALIFSPFLITTNSWCQTIAPCGQQLSAGSIYQGVQALSNGADQTTEHDCVGDTVVGTYGDQYQCVEYVRRFYSIAMGVDTSGWAHYNADQYYAAAGKFGLVAFPNGGPNPPAANDIVVFEGGPAGHVAVVTTVSGTAVDIIEQNWSYIGTASLAINSTSGSYTVTRTRSAYVVLGWLRLSSTSNNPVPTITQLSPATLPAAAAPQTLTINGTGFLSSSTVTMNGIAHSPAFVSASQLTISLTASDLATAGSFPVIVTNPAPGGGPSNSVSFVVTAQTVSVTVSPLTAQVVVNGSQQFAATVANTSNTAVTWSVNGVVGGNSTVGTISSNGLYTAPAGVPDPATLTVTATSQAVTTVSGSAQITVIPAVTLTVLHSFTGTDGAVPWASLIQTSGGTFYGTTVSGGDLSCYGYFGQGCGTAFNMDAEGNLIVLHSFTGPEGEIPSAPLILGSDSNFYGTTEFGGGSSNCLISGQSTPAGCGTAFKMDSLGNISTLYAFSSFSNPEGVAPTAPLLQAIDSNFYGTTLEGGDTSCSGSYGPSPTTGCGSIFMLDSSGSLTVLHEFTGTEGAYLSAPLIQVTGGNFYGLTLAGGNLSCSSYAAPGCGTIFTMTTSGGVTPLHSFSGSDGAFPTGSLILADDRKFYGSTVFGGDLSCAGGAQWQGCGVVFTIDSTGTFNLLHAFSVSDGAYPGSSLLQASDGYFYGTTQGGGDLTCTGRYGPGCGTVFRMDSEGNVVVLYSFTGGTDGSWPESNLMQGLDGNLYGTTAYGGTSDLGVVYQVSNFDSSGAATSATTSVKPDAVKEITTPRKGPHLGLPAPSPAAQP